MLPISCTMDLMEVSAPAAQKPSQMMLDDVGHLQYFLQWLWVPLKTGIEGVCRSLSFLSL